MGAVIANYVDPSGTASKKKNNKKKKNANKLKDPAQAGNEDPKRENEDGDDDEPESPTKTVSPALDKTSGRATQTDQPRVLAGRSRE